MGWRLPSYKSESCSRVNCPCGRNEEQPCWGETDVRGAFLNQDDDWHYVYRCEGHGDGPYRPSDRPEDRGQSPLEDGE